MDRDQFRSWIAEAIRKHWRIGLKTAAWLADEAFTEFVRDAGCAFGDAAYSWDRDAAEIIATEYVLRFGEPA